MYFRVRTTEGKRYILRYDESEDEWTLQSRFNGDELLARPSIELVTVDVDVIRRAEKEIESASTVILTTRRFRSIGFSEM
jgi:predicted RNA-binding protein with PUA domain